ncbi:40S ribosomal protein S8-like [Acinonyx jubatus]|uniref:40S ribosomal protein S8-like n=1 Tax=Acinonyx jubatus TaxID=32536 RepID=A0ABM3Q1U7_ACIJB|nr:40S ribosomal protein S8-like [Acinonyx jubatus]
MGLSGDEWQKCHKTGGKRKPHHRKQRYALGPPAYTQSALWGGMGRKKSRAWRLDVGTSPGAPSVVHKTKVVPVIYSAPSSQLVSTKPLVKILQGAGGRHTLPTAVWVPPALPLGHKKGAKLTPKEEEISSKKR